MRHFRCEIRRPKLEWLQVLDVIAVPCLDFLQLLSPPVTSGCSTLFVHTGAAANTHTYYTVGTAERQKIKYNAD